MCVPGDEMVYVPRIEANGVVEAHKGKHPTLAQTIDGRGMDGEIVSQGLAGKHPHHLGTACLESKSRPLLEVFKSEASPLPNRERLNATGLDPAIKRFRMHSEGPSGFRAREELPVQVPPHDDIRAPGTALVGLVLSCGPVGIASHQLYRRLSGPNYPPSTLWIKLVELVAELRTEGIRLSVNALLVLTLAEGLPADEAAALDVVGRRELALCDREPQPGREERTVRLPRKMLERYTALGKAAAAHGFPGARSAVINAVVAITGPQTAPEALALEIRARRARSAAVIREDVAPPA